MNRVATSRGESAVVERMMSISSFRPFPCSYTSSHSLFLPLSPSLSPSLSISLSLPFSLSPDGDDSSNVHLLSARITQAVPTLVETALRVVNSIQTRDKVLLIKGHASLLVPWCRCPFYTCDWSMLADHGSGLIDECVLIEMSSSRNVCSCVRVDARVGPNLRCRLPWRDRGASYQPCCPT